MEQKEWVIDSFSFIFKQKEYIVLLTRYLTDESKPSEYAKAKVEFIDLENIDDSLEGYIDFWNVYFFNLQDFFHFFEIEKTNTNNNVLNTFSEIFAKYIPKEKNVHKNRNIERQLMARRLDGNDPNAIYCFDVRRNGVNKKRSIENSNKTEILRPDLYLRFYKDDNLSFYFTNDPNKEETTGAIIQKFNERQKKEKKQ